MRAPLVRFLLGPSKGSSLPCGGTAATGACAYLTWAATTSYCKPTTAATAATPPATEPPLTGIRASRSPFSSSTSESLKQPENSAAAAVRAAVETLQEQLMAAAAEKQKRLQRIRAEYGAVKIGSVTPVNVIGGKVNSLTGCPLPGSASLGLPLELLVGA